MKRVFKFASFVFVTKNFVKPEKLWGHYTSRTRCWVIFFYNFYFGPNRLRTKIKSDREARRHKIRIKFATSSCDCFVINCCCYDGWELNNCLTNEIINCRFFLDERTWGQRTTLNISSARKRIAKKWEHMWIRNSSSN
jgi:hypothetical protein